MAVGGTLGVEASGCETAPGNQSARRVELVLITVTPDGERATAFGADGLSIPGWVDPANPAVLAGRCLQSDYQSDGSTTTSVAFTYSDVPVDITPGAPGVINPQATLSRSTLAAGQTLAVDRTGCVGGQAVFAQVGATADLSGRSGIDSVAGNSPEIYGGKLLKYHDGSFDPGTGMSSLNITIGSQVA